MCGLFSLSRPLRTPLLYHIRAAAAPAPRGGREIPDIHELAYVRGFRDYPAVLTGGRLRQEEKTSEDNFQRIRQGNTACNFPPCPYVSVSKNTTNDKQGKYGQRSSPQTAVWYNTRHGQLER